MKKETTTPTHDCCADHNENNTEQVHEPAAHHCCHGEHASPPSSVSLPGTAKYFCPMCPGVESNKPGACPKCGMALEVNPTHQSAQKIIYTCPMHPQIEQDHPGQCPICGMTLELKTPEEGSEEDNAELNSMTRRFWIGLALTVPVLILSMGEFIPGLNGLIQSLGRTNVVWAEFLLSTPVVLWAGWPFFERGGRSLVTRHLNMFTLISMGTGAAYLYSVVATLMPSLFPESFRMGGAVAVYFEAAAVITVLVLLGQVLELKARASTGAAIKALLGLAPKTARLVNED